MLRKSFFNKLKQLNKKIIRMGLEVENKMEQTIKAINHTDIETAKTVYQNDNTINKIEHNIEQYCINLLALEQPIAGDLRHITGYLKIITDLERIADQCADICEIIINDGINQLNPYLNNIKRLLNIAYQMLLKTVELFSDKDIDKAIFLCKSDDDIDNRYADIVYFICKNMKENSDDIMGDMSLIFISKYIERIGDHCTNIAEWIIYIKTGEHPDLNY